MKYIFLSLITLTIISCNNKSIDKVEISKLQKTNDSLKTILDTLKTKFIFDHASVRHFPGKNKPLKAGEKYQGEILIVAYNDEDKMLFTQTPNSNDFDTLSVKSIWDSSYIYETIAKKDSNKYIFRPLVKDKTALEFKNSMLGSGIIFSDSKVIK